MPATAFESGDAVIDRSARHIKVPISKPVTSPNAKPVQPQTTRRFIRRLPFSSSRCMSIDASPLSFDDLAGL